MDSTRAVVGGGTQTAVRIAGLASVGITAPLLVRHLGPAAYGRFAIALTVAFIVATIADLGLPLLASRDWQRLDMDVRRNWLRQFWSLRIWSGVLVVVLAVGTVLALRLDTEMGTALVVALFGVPVILALNSLGALFLSHFDPWPGVWSEIASRLVWIVGLIVAIGRDASMVGTLSVLVASQAVGLAFMVVPAIRRGLFPKPRLSRLSGDLARRAAPLALIPVLGVIYARADTLVMAALTTDAETGIYGALWRLVEVLISMAVIGAGLLLPLLSRTDDQGQRRIHYLRAIRLLMTALIPAAVIVAISSRDILGWFGGTGFFVDVDSTWGVSSPSSALVVLMAATVLMGFGVVNASVMVAAHRQRALIRQSVLVALLNFGLAWFLIGRISFFGAALAVLATELFSIVHSSLVVRGVIGRLPVSEVLTWPLAIGAVVTVSMMATGGISALPRLLVGVLVASVGAALS
ncbi:MAG: oligosaccharide flippase family protein, partial [Acidimicrobiia bacterium]|nr:oligosaccharide flippase family protein [Acidimicrobiia bacterium]